MDFLQNRFELGKEEKVTGTISGECRMCSKVAMSFLQEIDEYSRLCEQEHYCDGASMCGLSKGSASCHALISQGIKECLYRLFVSLFGLGVGIQNE